MSLTVKTVNSESWGKTSVLNTLTMQESEKPPSTVVTVIVAMPLERAVIKPFSSTDATEASEF